MPESTKPQKEKKLPSWLSGEEHEPQAARSTPRSNPGRRSQGPLAEDDTGELPSVQRPPRDREAGGRPVADATAPTETVPRVTMSGAGEGSKAGQQAAAPAPAQLLERLRANPAPAALVLLVVLVLAVAVWFLFLRGEGEEQPAEGGSAEGVIGARPAPEDPFGGGPVRDSGVVFGALQQEDGKAELDGAGLNWQGTVSKKEGEAGETVTLEGPTAAQLERGFDLGPSSVETGVYAVAQDTGQVLHVTTHTFLPKEGGAQAEELTLGTVYALEEGRLDGYAYYLDQRQDGSDKVTRTYVRPGESSYRVSYSARPGTFVPLLVGWRGFGDESTGDQEGE